MFLFLPDNEAVEVGDGRGEDLQPHALLAGRRDKLEHVLHGPRPDVVYRIEQGVAIVVLALKIDFICTSTGIG